ncbi:MAG: alginate export family protein [Granulosicoccus sp.]
MSVQVIAQPVLESQMLHAVTTPTVESMHAKSWLAFKAITLAPPVFEGDIEMNLQYADEKDNDSELRRDTGEMEIQLTLELDQKFRFEQRLVAQLELNARRFTENTLNTPDDEFSYDLERLYFQWKPSNSFRLRTGRFNLDDPMESIVDEDLDGIQVIFEQDRIEFELSRTREDWFEASTAGRNDQITNTMGTVQFSSNKNSSWMPYILHRTTDPVNGMLASEVTWLGLQGIVQPAHSPVRYWFHGSVQNGEETDDQETMDLGGYALDIGFNWTANGQLPTTYTVGLARATGGSRSQRFRQSGLHSNDFALNGQNTFRYLGEVMDPELTNILILTLGAGADLGRHWSGDIALHHYQQVEVEDSLRGSDIEYDPLGESGDLGFGADLVVAYDPHKQFDFKGTAGMFAPGDAFDSNRDIAWVTRVELTYKF